MLPRTPTAEPNEMIDMTSRKQNPLPSPGHDRRDFLKTASLAGIGTAAVPWAWTRPAFANRSQNDRPVAGCIGVGSMGTGDARDVNNFADIVAVCDVDSRRGEAARIDERIGKGTADVYSDYRHVLDRDDIDVVSIVTPDHWHVKIAIEALQAGKHVFCQKPLSLTLEENRLIRRPAALPTRCFSSAPSSAATRGVSCVL